MKKSAQITTGGTDNKNLTITCTVCLGCSNADNNAKCKWGAIICACRQVVSEKTLPQMLPYQNYQLNTSELFIYSLSYFAACRNAKPKLTLMWPHNHKFK